MADTNCSPLQKNSKGENGERRRRRQTDRGDWFCRAYVKPWSPFQFYQRVGESFLIHGRPPPPTSQVGACLHRCQETSRQMESPAGWQKLLLGFLKPNYGVWKEPKAVEKEWQQDQPSIEVPSSVACGRGWVDLASQKDILKLVHPTV